MSKLVYILIFFLCTLSLANVRALDVIPNSPTGKFDSLWTVWHNEGQEDTARLHSNKLQFARAYNLLWIVRNGEVIELKGDRQPIGNADDPKPFTTHCGQSYAGTEGVDG
ncbi:MAG: hypothetical protein JKY52_04545 [Flavobacteriales bacterium]|nr:hypothetical protein [Flavobacteriales bacterium]